MTDDLFYLVHIRERIARIRRYTASSADAFFADTIVQDAVIRVPPI